MESRVRIYLCARDYEREKTKYKKKMILKKLDIRQEKTRFLRTRNKWDALAFLWFMAKWEFPGHGIRWELWQCPVISSRWDETKILIRKDTHNVQRKTEWESCTQWGSSEDLLQIHSVLQPNAEEWMDVSIWTVGGGISTIKRMRRKNPSGSNIANDDSSSYQPEWETS